MSKGETAVVLGGFGLVGNAISASLEQAGWHVIRAARSCVDGPSTKKIDILSLSDLEKLVSEARPSVVVNAVNLATVCAKDPASGYVIIQKFYKGLYEALKGFDQKLHYVHIGTTGMGGQGFNNPFNACSAESLNYLFNKASFAGISSSLLLVLSRSFPHGNIKVSEVKPGRAIFGESVSKEKAFGVNLVTIDGGEGGDYTYDEMMLISRFMGFKPASRIGAAVVEVIRGTSGGAVWVSGDSVDASNKAAIDQDETDTAIQTKLEAEMRRGIGDEPAIITRGTLVSPQMTRDLLLAALIRDTQAYGQTLASIDLSQSQAVQASLAAIKEAKPALHDYLLKELTSERASQLLPWCSPEREVWQAAEGIARKEYGLD